MNNKETLMQTSKRLFTLASTVALAAGLAACGTYDPYGPNNYPVSQAARTLASRSDTSSTAVSPTSP